jgi:hypothetical protein
MTYQTWLIAALVLADPPAAPLVVESAKPRPDLTALFVRTSGWTGSDGAYSIALGPKRSLWLFGDTWIGRVEDGRREEARMVNNSAAWMDLGGEANMQFFWDNSGKDPAALLKPEKAGEWYWPGDGAVIDGKLYLFCHVLRRKEQGPPAFQFDWFADDLLCINNPNEEPAKWKFERRRLSSDLKFGVACCFDGDHFYAYGNVPGPRKPLDAPLAVARIRKDKLAKLDMSAWETHGKDGWTSDLRLAEPIFRDGATEMSVQRLRGIDGWLAVYMPLGISHDIVVRHAERPEGPWSAPLKVYRCPDEAKDVFLYAGKGHAELAERDGQLIVTYCRNLGALGEHIKRPEIYAPQVVEVQLRKK